MSLASLSTQTSSSSDDAVLTKAVLRAAERLALTQTALGRVLGVSPSTVSRMASTPLSRDKPKELAILFVRVYRSLLGIVGDDEAAARWLASENSYLGGIPAELIQRVDGLARTLHYLDAMRAKV